MQSGSEMKTGVNNDVYQNTISPPPYTEPAVVLAPTRTVLSVQGTTVIHQGPTTIPTVVPVIVSQQMGYEPTPYVCKSCNHHIVTRVERRPNTRTHLFALCLCLIGCWPCVCLPYCMNACNNADHYCASCGAYIGSYTS